MGTRLDDRVAVVTGGARGLGAGIARRLADEGAVVVIADVIDGTETASSLPPSPAGRKSKYVHLDVTDAAECERVMQEVREEYGSLEILANNAGVSQPIGHLVDTDDEVIDRVLAVNVKGVIYCSRAAVRIMKEQGGGRIINSASQVGKSAWPEWGIYSASKAAVIAITQVMALEHAADKIFVNAICPGTMLSDMTRTGMSSSLPEGKTLEEGLQEKGASIPVGRLGTPEDVGAMVAWLASDDAGFTTGAALNLTGGEMVSF